MADTSEDASSLADKLAAKQKELSELDGKIKEVTGRDPNERRPKPLRGDRDRDRLRGQRDRGDFRDPPVDSRLGARRGSERRPPDEFPRRERGREWNRSTDRNRDRDRDRDREAPPPPPPPPSQPRPVDPEDAARRAEAEERASAARQERIKRARRSSGESGIETKRNKRLFGMLTSAIRVGGAKTERQKIAENIQKKVSTKLAEEREAEYQKRKELFTSRREAQQEIDRLASEVLQKEMQPVWDAHNNSLCTFLLTKSEPRIFFVPAKHNDTTEAMLENAKAEVDDMVAGKLERAAAAAAKRRAKAMGSNANTSEPDKDEDIRKDEDDDDDDDDNDGRAKRQKLDQDDHEDPPNDVEDNNE